MNPAMVIRAVAVDAKYATAMHADVGGVAASPGLVSLIDDDVETPTIRPTSSVRHTKSPRYCSGVLTRRVSQLAVIWPCSGTR